MKLRAKLIMAFVLLSVVPLAGITLFSYWSARRAMAASLEAEADALTRGMERRMNEVRHDLERGVRRVGPRLVRQLARARDTGEPLSKDELELLMAELGDNAALIDTFTVLPMPPEAPRPPGPPPNGLLPPAGVPPPEPRADGMDDLPPGAAWVVDVAEVIDQARRGVEDSGAPAARLGVELGLTIVRELMESGLKEALAAAEVAELEAQAEVEARDASKAEDQRALAERRRAREEKLETLSQRLARRRGAAAATRREGAMPHVTAPDRELHMLGMEFDTTVREGDEVLGRVAPTIRRQAVIAHVLTRTDRARGEIPFALDAEGTLFVADEPDRMVLAPLALGSGSADRPLDSGAREPLNAPAVAVSSPAGGGDEVQAGDSTARRVGDWLVVQSSDPDSGLSFGIARPLGDSFKGVQQAALQSFLTGLGLIAVALLGIVALSRRMTRNLELVTSGAERVAAGDLDTEVPVRSRDEIGQLAGTFNRMAHRLRINQAQLVEQELDQRLLSVELTRKNDELEQARRFQLAMLPETLPDHPRFEVAVAMQTATEVGGDYYDFRVEGDCMTVAIGDATGHGATAGRMVTVVKTLLTAHDTLDDPAAFLAGANGAVQRMSLGRMAMALALARFRPDRLVLAAAGMPPALIYRQASGTVDEVTAPGMPLGGLDYAYQAEHVPLAVGDVVLLSSDGYPELPDAKGEPLGYDAVRRHFARVAPGAAPQAIVDALLADVAHRTGAAAPADDVTFVVIRVR